MTFNSYTVIGSVLLFSLCGEWRVQTYAFSAQADQPKTHADTRVPDQVSALIRPILDLREESLRECGEPGVPSRCTDGDTYVRENERRKKRGELIYELTKENSANADESLVVLMCFYLGESQEETDAVISRGRRMLAYLNKYRRSDPIVRNPSYPGSMLKSPTAKAEDFTGALTAIKQRRHSTSDTPQG